MLFEHFEHFFPADLNGSPQRFSRALYEATYKAVLPLQTQQQGCQNLPVLYSIQPDLYGFTFPLKVLNLESSHNRAQNQAR